MGCRPRWEDVIRVYRADAPCAPTAYRRGQMAEAEPAVPGWTMPVDELVEIGRPAVSALGFLLASRLSIRLLSVGLTRPRLFALPSSESRRNRPSGLGRPSRSRIPRTRARKLRPVPLRNPGPPGRGGSDRRPGHGGGGVSRNP